MDESLIEVKGISKTFKIKDKSSGLKAKLKSIIKTNYINKKAVNNISFSIKKGPPFDRGRLFFADMTKYAFAARRA